MNIQLICLVMISLVSLGCSREYPNPETIDQIYQDLTSQKRTFDQLREESLKKIEKAEKDLAKSDIRTIERKNAEGDLLKARIALKKADEMIEYLDIRVQQRQFFVRTEYKKAFQKNIEFTQKEQFESYKINKNLKSAPMSWDKRVPRSIMQQKTYESSEDLASKQSAH